MTKPLRMNQGDRTEGRVYFLPHFVAHRLGYFDAEGVAVEFTWAQPGNFMAKSGQLPAVLAGEADLTVGGPMVTMRMQADGTARLVNFCALVQKNPWFIAARQPSTSFSWSDLIGKTIIDVGTITTAALSLRWLLARNGIDESQVTIVEADAPESETFAAFLAGEGDYVFHSAHALGPYLQAGTLHIVKALADDNGDVPWSAYVAKPEVIAERAGEFDAFVRAISRSLHWVASATPEQIAETIAEDYPDYPFEALITAIAVYKDLDVWAHSPLIPEGDFTRFRGMLIDVGWFKEPVPYSDQVPADIAMRAIEAVGQ